MLVKNTSKKIIGFGNFVLLQNSTGELPVGYDETHPTIKYYLQKGWLKAVNVNTAAEPKNEDSDVDKKIKEIAKMNLESLRAETTALGVEFTEADTRAILIDKITAKLKTEQE